MPKCVDECLVGGPAGERIDDVSIRDIRELVALLGEHWMYLRRV